MAESCQDSDPGQAQSAAAMCPQDQRMACLGGWATMLLLMLLPL